MSENPVQNVTFPTPGGADAHGYLALPPGGTGPGLIVIQEWWGLDDYLASITDKLAAAGFVALAPDLYGKPATHDSNEAGALMQGLPVEKAVTELGGAVDFLLGHEAVTSTTVGAIGFCMGGGFVLQLAATRGDQVSAAVPFYGVLQGETDFSTMTAAVQGHYGLKDDFYPADAAKAMAEKITEQTGHAPDMHYYDRGHAFMNEEDRMGTFDQGDHDTAWSTAVAFLTKTIS